MIDTEKIRREAYEASIKAGQTEQYAKSYAEEKVFAALLRAKYEAGLIKNDEDDCTNDAESRWL